MSINREESDEIPSPGRSISPLAPRALHSSPSVLSEPSTEGATSDWVIVQTNLRKQNEHNSTTSEHTTNNSSDGIEFPVFLDDGASGLTSNSGSFDFDSALDIDMVSDDDFGGHVNIEELLFSESFDWNRTRSYFPEVCTICFEMPLITQDVSTLACTHRFHQSCISVWLEQQQSCPNCRSQP